MKNKFKYMIITIFLVLCNLSVASSSETEVKVQLKKGGAVSDFLKEEGFKLSEKAIKNLGVSFTSIGKGQVWNIPSSALVRIKNSVGVYRRYNDWITMVFVDVISKNRNRAQIQSVDLQYGDEVAVSGVTFLRMTDADLNSDTVDACSH